MSTGPERPGETDVLVVGGGIVGTAAAYFLAAGSDRGVTLVERDGIAAGSTGDSSAILRHHYGPDAVYTRMAAWSHRFYREFEAETGQPLARADSPLVRFAAEGTGSADYVEAGERVLREEGLPVSRYEADELGEQYPMYDGEVLDRFEFAISDDSAGYSDGTDAAGGFARAAAEAGATVVTGVGVESLVAEDGRVVGAGTTEGPIECEVVVVAAGPWTPELAETVGVEVPITPTREQVVVLEPPEDYVERYPDLTPTTSMPGGEWYLRPDFGGGVLVATHHYSEAVDPDDYDEDPDESTLLELTDVVAESIPELAEAGIRGRYCGVYSVTPDHDFVIDEAGPEGCFLACGFSGHGFKHGPAVGRIVRDLVVDGGTDLVDADYFSLSRFDEDPRGHGPPADSV